MNDYIDGVQPAHALSAPSAQPRDVPHEAISSEHFADQMAVFDRMRQNEIDLLRMPVRKPVIY